MDINKQKLKSRLNIKFEPIHSQRKSLKKIQEIEAKQKVRNDDSIVSKIKSKDDNTYIKIRSNSQIKLPSLSNKNRMLRHETLEDSKSYVNVGDLRQKAKSYKQIPRVRIQSKQAINNTITYLMKNEVLNVPRIIALLQKNQSDEFIYLKVTGFYEYEAVDSLSKGSSYVTISKNGMVQNDELIPLQTLVQQFDVFKKIKKIGFFKYFALFKFLGKWKQGSKKVRFAQNKRSLNKQLYLGDHKFLDWKMQIFSFFQIPTQGGWLKGTWMHKVAQSLSEMKINSKNRLAQICFKMLQSFQLPISQSTDLMNRVIGNLNAMNITFEKKIRIEKQCQKVYVLGRQLEFSAMEKTSYFILTHLSTLISRIQSASSNYNVILDRLQHLKIQQQNYNQQKQRILLDSSTELDLDYTLYYNPQNRILGIRPSPSDLYQDCISHIKIFLTQMDKIGFKIIRTDQFKFILKSVFKSGLENEDYQFQRNIFRNLVLGMPKYQQFSKLLQSSFHSFENIFQRRIEIAKPFLDLYLSYLDDKRQKYQFTSVQLNFEHNEIQEHLEFCEKLSDGQNFVFGYLHLNEFKKQLKVLIRSHEQKIIKKVPFQIDQRRMKLIESLTKHLNILSGLTDNALSFIKISQQVEIIQENILDYSVSIEQNEKIIAFYQRVAKSKINNFQHQKKMLNQIKILVKNFLLSKENNFSKYRKSLQDEKDSLTKKIVSYQVKDDAFYDPQSDPKQMFVKISSILQNLKKLQNQLLVLNNLETYYHLKLTFVSNLEIRINQYQNLQQIWRISHSIDKDKVTLMRSFLKNINTQNYLKFYETFKKKAEKFMKDTDLVPITKKCLQKVDKFLNDMQTILSINSSHLRQKDIDQINYTIERTAESHYYGAIKCRQLTYDRFSELKVADLKLVISQIVFKAKKELQITQNLNLFHQWWKGIRLEHQTLEEYPSIAIFGENQKLRDQIDEYMTLILNILNNKYGTFVRAQCNQLLKRMNNLIQILQLAQIHQQKFLSLFPILTSKYAENQLSTQYKKFDSILNKTMKNVRILAKPTQNLNQGMKAILNTNIKQFDSLLKILSRFLQKKRVKFQRFYFLQDYQLLEVLVGIADQKNVFRMFEGIKGWLVSPQGIKIGVIGVGDEHLVLRGWNYKNIEPELVFRSLQQTIKSNLNSIVRNLLYQYQIQMKQLKQLYENVPWMCLYAVEMILFAKQVQINCFHNEISLTAQQSLIRQAISRAIVKPAQFSNYITMLLHLLHFTQQMHKENTQSIFDFQWHSFLRYYYQKDSVVMRSLSNQIKWGSEYQGLWSLMVNTSDIRRAHICVLNNLQYANGVLLQGPSGTGKTQSLKQLARCTAKYCVIFNCSQSVNLKTMGKLLSGLCYTASWICLDQINRLTLQAMSSIAKQIQTIKNAILMKKQQFNFLGKDIKLRQGVAIFSTMNPIYLKRAKLTQNIKSLFRIITVAMPDSEVILQIMLYGLKYHNPRQLARKISSTFSNLSVQLSKSSQYDFGLRSMKSLINLLSKQPIDVDKQNQAVSKAFYEIFQFRLSSTDRIVFQKVVMDIFKYKPSFFNLNLQARVKNMVKSPQTGLIVFGPVSVKSMLIKQYCSMFKDSDVSIFNPNSVDLRYFLGETVHSRWEEGIVEKIARSSLSYPDKMHILVLDSTLKSQIIENFNTLLDQSKLLTLSNGTRLKIQNNFKLVMETPHLHLTSPSTITRCNVIYVCDKDVQTKSLIQAQFPESLKHHESVQKLRKIYLKLNNNQIRQIGQLSKIIIGQQFTKRVHQWKENQILGIEKAIIFAARILGFQSKIQQFIQKQNSFHSKKNPFHHILAYNRYAQGEFIQISRTQEPILQYQSFILKTSQQIFMKWLTTKSTIRQRQPILWKGAQFIGISTSLCYSLKSSKYMKIAMSSDLSSTALVRLLLPQMLDKKVDDIKQQPQLIIYLENLHMSNEQVSQQIRFMMEHNKLFSVQTKQVVQIQAMAFVAQSRHLDSKQNDRVRRHFSEITIPFIDQIQVKNIYCQFIKYYLEQTNIVDTLKNSINIQSQRFSTFLAAIYERKNEKKISSNEKLGVYFAIRILQRIKCLNQDNCKQINDFISYMFQAIKLEDTFLNEKDQQILIQAYHEFYKGKFVKQFDSYLKNFNIILQNSNIAKSQKKKKQQIQHSEKAYIKEQLLFHNGQEYVPDYIVSQIQMVLRILEKYNSNYCLLGEECSGRKTIFRLACKIGNLNYFELPEQLNQKQIKKIYFQKLKSAFQTKIKQVIILDLKFIEHRKFIKFVENVTIGQSTISLFDSQETDYMYATILDHAQLGYSKSSKSYDEVCQDYVKFSHQQVQLLIASPLQTENNLQQYPALRRNTYFWTVQQFPVQSIVQSIDKIMQSKLKLDSYLRQSQSIQSLPRVFMKIYKVLHNISVKNKQNNVHHFKFNQFHIFKVVQLFCGEFQKTLARFKENEDILNRSILKMMETTNILQSLKAKIMKMQPEIEARKQRILQVVPLLQEKKKKTEAIKYAVQAEGKQIETKQQQIESIMQQVNDQINEATPLLNEAVDSIQTVKRSDLSQIKNNMNSHPLIKFTLQNMVILFGQSQNWENVKKILSDANLLVRIKNCHPSQESYLKVKKRIQQNPEWTFDMVTKVSYGSRYLYKWIKSIIKYKDIEQQINKKKEYIEKLKVSLKSSEQKAQKKLSELSERQKDSIEIQIEYSQIKKQLNDLQQLMDRNKRKTANAQKIKDSLKQSVVKWQTKLGQSKQIKYYLNTYCIFLCLNIKIFPSLTIEQHTYAKQQIIKVFMQQQLIVPKDINIYSDIRNHDDSNIFNKLSYEDLKENKKIMLAYHLYKMPIIIDPDNQAINWISNLDFGKKITYSKKNFNAASKITEDAMRNGDILIVLIDEEIDHFCKQILKSLKSSRPANRHLIEYNNNLFSLNTQFVLIFLCKSKSPKINIKASLDHQVINFEITKLSIHQSLLQAALKNEKPQLYEMKSRIEHNIEEISKNIQKMQADIINSLLSNKKDLIQDQSFAELLSESKNKTQFFALNKKEQQNKIIEVQTFVRQFSEICSEAADVFMVLKEVSKLNSNLVWDVQIFIQYFVQSCFLSIVDIVQTQQQGDELLDASFIGGYEFQEVQRADLSRPGTAISAVSFSTSQILSQQPQDQSQQQLINARVETQQMAQQKKEEEFIQNQVKSKSFDELFNTNIISIDDSQRGFVNQNRFNKIRNNLLNSIKKGLTTKERNIWALLLSLKTQRKEDLKCLIALVSAKNKKKNLQTLINQNMVTQGIKNYFSNIQSSNIEAQSLRLLLKAENIEQQNVEKSKTLLTQAQILIIGYVIYPEKFLNLIQAIISRKKLQTILDYQELRVIDWLKKDDNIHPTLLFMGEDPVSMISQFLQRKKYKNATLVAMGDDQGKGLDLIIEKESRKEGIFIIHNIHIATNFIPLLSRVIQQFHYKPPHKNFRLVLISNIDASLPEQITSVCHKYIVEQPLGLKNKMKGLYKKSELYVDHGNPNQHKLAYSLCFMHSLINQMQKYGTSCWNFPPSFTTDDFIGSLFAIKQIFHQKNQLNDYLCNIDAQQVEKKLNNQNIDFKGLRYLIGQTCYIGKMADNIDRSKMRIIVQNHFNDQILKHNYKLWQGDKISQDPSEVTACIERIEQQNPKTFGLHEGTLPSKQISQSLLNQLINVYQSNLLIKTQKNTQKFDEIKPISHRLGFVNSQIQTYNLNGVYQQYSRLLKQITQNTNIFNLKAFSNPRQLFVNIKIQAAIKNNVPYDGIALIWSVGQKQGSYGICNLNLEGACLKNGSLIAGTQQKQITLFFNAVVKKKEKDPNKGKAVIPLYLNEQRGQSIGADGENTNLLTQVYLDSKQSPETWIIKGTAFIVS